MTVQIKYIRKTETRPMYIPKWEYGYEINGQPHKREVKHQGKFLQVQIK